MAEYIQIGITAERDAEGNFLPAVPLFIERTEAAERSAEGLIADFLPLVQARFAMYANASGLVESKAAARAEVLEAATEAEAAAAAEKIAAAAIREAAGISSASASSAISSRGKRRGRKGGAGA